MAALVVDIKNELSSFVTNDKSNSKHLHQQQQQLLKNDQSPQFVPAVGNATPNTPLSTIADFSVSTQFEPDFVTSSSNKQNVILSSVLETNTESNPTDSSKNLHIPPSAHLSNMSDIGQYLSETSKTKINAIVNEVEKLTDIEKLYLYLQLPDGTCNNQNDNSNNEKKKVIFNPFGKKTDAEVIQTYAWIQSHLEEDISVSIPKHEVYEEYRAFCDANKFEKLCVADFGKAMKQIFPHVKPRRLGQRGNSKYCYSGLKKKILVECPELPILETNDYKCCNGEEVNKKNGKPLDDLSWSVILEWVEKTFNRKFKNGIDFARHLIETQEMNISKALGNNVSLVNSNAVKNLSLKNSTAKKKDGYNQISIKKVHDQKKQCDITAAFEQPYSTEATLQQMKAISSKSVVCHQEETIRSEIKNDLSVNNNISSKAIKTASDVGKTAIPTTDTKNPLTMSLSRFSFASTSPQSTIILLSGGQAITSETLSNQVFRPNKGSHAQVLNQSVDSTTINVGTLRYKPIQPKITGSELSRISQANESETFKTELTLSADKRRHSVTAPFNFEVKKEFEVNESSYSNGQKLLDNNDKNHKRQIDEKELEFMNKKRHTGKIIQTIPIAETSLVSSNAQEDKESTSNQNCDLKVNELENEALYDYLNINTSSNTFDNENIAISASNMIMNDACKEPFTQIKKLLENNLMPNSAQSGQIVNAEHIDQATIKSENSLILPNLYLDHNDSGSVSLASKSSYLLQNCTLVDNNVQVGQVTIPPSPNSRRRAFSFQPISPRHTPTIPDNFVFDVHLPNNKPSSSFNGFNNLSQSVPMHTVAMSSQPPSESNSPFISPRNTPVSLCSISRSRNSSGQSNYSSSYMPTPLPSFDSGVSSISNSPFVSPHSTPIPGLTRIRSLDNSTHSRNLSRVRHSSGPGGPINRSQISNIMAYNRSNSLSPMIDDNAFTFSNNDNWNSTQNLNSSFNAANNGSLVKLCNDVQPIRTKFDVVAETRKQEIRNKMCLEDSSFNMPSISNPDNLSFQQKSLQRQRHFSNPYGGAATNSALMKADESDSFKTLLSRSQSVPLNQMFQTDLLDPTIESQFSGFLETSDGHTPNMQLLESAEPIKPFTVMSLSDDNFELAQGASMTTATPVAVHNGNETEANNYLSGSTIEELLTSENVIRSGQDLIVSSVQINQGITSGSGGNDLNATSSVDSLNAPSPMLLTKIERDDFNDLLINENEHFQTLDEFRDCDNDFSNIELENAANAYSNDVYKFN